MPEVDPHKSAQPDRPQDDPTRAYPETPLSVEAAHNNLRPDPPKRLGRSDLIFIGPDGLRAGWSLLLFLSIIAILFLGFDAFMHVIDPQPQHTILIAPEAVVLNEGIHFLFVLFAAWIMSKIEDRPARVYGLARTRLLPNFLSGLVWGVAFLSLLILCLKLSGVLVFNTRLLFGGAAFGYAFAWFLAFLLVGFFEEYLGRGYLQFTLARGLGGLFGWLRTPHRETCGFWTSAIILSFAFGAVHVSNQGESPIGLVAAGLIGLVFCLSLWRTGSLWWAIGFHATWDWAESYLYGVADSGTMVKGHLFAAHPHGSALLSGGFTGPEGSILALPIIALVAIVIVYTLPRTGPLLQPQVHDNPPLPHPTGPVVD